MLITGAAGFAGSHLAARLSGRADLYGTHLDNNLENVSGVEGLKMLECDLLDHEKVASIVKRVSPDRVFHLAGLSAPSTSYANPGETLKVNIFSTLNLFEAVLDACPDAVILNIGSGDEYGEVAGEDLPIKETTELKPLNPYAVSKVTQDLMAYQYWKSRGLKAVRCRPFNHFGPRQSDNFAASSFAKQIAEIEAGKKERLLKVGSLEAAKDFLYVKDVVAAYELLMDKGVYGEVYNICSGKPVKISWMLDALLSFSKEKIEVIQDPARLRAKETPTAYGDAAKLRFLGWAPECRLEEGLEELLNFWRAKVSMVS